MNTVKSALNCVYNLWVRVAWLGIGSATVSGLTLLAGVILVAPVFTAVTTSGAQYEAGAANPQNVLKVRGAPVSTAVSPTVFGLAANGDGALRDARAKIGVKPGVVGVFTDFTQLFPSAAANKAAATGASLLISWEPQDSSLPQQVQPAYSLHRITQGHFDSYISSFARAAAATHRPVFVRFAPEMNGDWQVWSTGFNENAPGDYIAAYRHVTSVARAAGGTNIKWVFNPITSYDGSTPLSQLYPGDDQVDWVALDGYNWGPLKPWGWQSFTDIFTMGLAELRSVAPSKPLAITEIGCAPGAGKAAWITDAFTQAHAAGARMFVWFEHNKETDWRLGSDPLVVVAARKAATAPGWVTGGNYRKVAAALR